MYVSPSGNQKMTIGQSIDLFCTCGAGSAEFYVNNLVTWSFVKEDSVEKKLSTIWILLADPEKYAITTKHSGFQGRVFQLTVKGIEIY